MSNMIFNVGNIDKPLNLGNGKWLKPEGKPDTYTLGWRHFDDKSQGLFLLSDRDLKVMTNESEILHNKSIEECLLEKDRIESATYVIYKVDFNRNNLGYVSGVSELTETLENAIGFSFKGACEFCKANNDVTMLIPCYRMEEAPKGIKTAKWYLKNLGDSYTLSNILEKNDISPIFTGDYADCVNLMRTTSKKELEARAKKARKVLAKSKTDFEKGMNSFKKFLCKNAKSAEFKEEVERLYKEATIEK